MNAEYYKTTHEESMGKIYSIATGEHQVCETDSEALGLIAKLARPFIPHQLPERTFSTLIRPRKIMNNQYRKKPVVIEAVQWTGNNQTEMAAFMGVVSTCENKIEINTLEGTLTASLLDWVLKGVNGEFYPCKPDIFHKTYEKVI